MKRVSEFLAQSASFAKDRSGSMAVLSAAAIFGVALAAGSALDFSRVAHTKSVISDALDAAILAAGNDLSNGKPVNAELRENFENFFHSNINLRAPLAGDYSVVEFSVDEDTGEIHGKVSGEIEMTLMKFAGYDTMTLETEATAIFSSSDVEIAMMLDVTGSMRGSKINSLRLAASDAVNILMPDPDTQGVRIGLVPYSWSVNAGSYASTATNGAATTGCVTERMGAEAFSDESALVAPVGADNRAAGKCPNQGILPLSDNRGALITEINSMSARGYTAGHLGVAWSYYMLSEKWQDLWPNESDPADYSEDVRKVAVLMTDGEFNTFYDGTSGQAWGPYVNESSTRAEDICDDMKAPKAGEPGIIVYSVAFQAPSAAEATLRECASPDTATETYYFSANSEQELRNAFRAIAGSIKTLRLAK